MKRVFPLYVLLSLALFACDKDDKIVYNTLEGLWKMERVQDNTTGNISTRPPSIQGDVELSFLSVSATDGIINGNSPTNSLTSHYYIGDNQAIIVGDIGMTKTAETSWGLLFIEHAPKAHHYSLSGNGHLLKIFTDEKVLVFVRK